MSSLRLKLGLSQQPFAKLLGVSRNYVSMIEQGREPSDSLKMLIDRLEKENDAPVREDAAPYSFERRDLPPGAQDVRWVPMISWAHAGAAVNYEELPLDDQVRVPTTCRDPKAFSLTVEGDSMEPRIHEGDQLVLMPAEEPRNSCLVVAKLRDDGVVVRRFMRLPNERIRLIAYNELYPPVDYTPKDFHWIYPVHSTVRKEW